MTTQTGNLHFRAPEMFSGNDYTSQVDVWAIGAIFNFMMTGAFPFDHKNEAKLISQILSG
jgi:serine/threonine protein kinase